MASGIRPTSIDITEIPAIAGKIVVDTSVLIKWIKTKDEELLLEAHRLLNRIEARHLDVHVPALLLYEAGNILLLKTDLDASSLDGGKTIQPYIYDVSFLTLAVELDCPFITADRRFFERTQSLPRVRHLSKVGNL